MRETVTVFICILIFIIALQTGIIRTGLDYTAMEKKCETLQASNDRLGQEIKRLNSQGQVLSVGPEAGEAEKVQQAIEDLKRQLDMEVNSGDVVIRENNGWLVMDLMENVIFYKRSLQIKRNARTLLVQLAQVLNRFPDQEIQITVYTDNSPLSKTLKEVYPTHRHFASAQAVTLAEYFEQQGKLDPTQIRVAGCGAFRPSVPNDTALHRSLNSHIEIALQPIEANVLAKARNILVRESRTQSRGNESEDSTSPEPKTEVKEEGAGEEVIGEEALDSVDGSNFDAGYAKPTEESE